MSRTLTLFLLLAACDAPADSPELDAAPANEWFCVTVDGGFGSGRYQVGDEVHVWADVDPEGDVVTAWTGDTSLLPGPAEWHASFTMPARDVTLSAQKRAVSAPLVMSTFTGPTGIPRTTFARLPAGAKGLILFFHGTGGSARFITTPETAAVALLALDRGYAVLGTESAESALGDQNGDGNERWNTAPVATNQDLIDLDALIAQLRNTNAIGPTTPIYALGMSNGGATSLALGAVAATPVAATFPNLRFAAVVVHCADGAAQLAQVTTTPTAWRMCGRDDNPEVSNSEAMTNRSLVAARGIESEYVESTPSPLYDARFTRAGLAASASAAIAGELRAAGYNDERGLFTTPSTAIQAAVLANPSAFPTLTAQPPTARAAIIDQVRAMEAEHQMYSDLAAHDVAWFDAHP